MISALLTAMVAVLMEDAKIGTSDQWSWVYTGEDGTDE